MLILTNRFVCLCTVDCIVRYDHHGNLEILVELFFKRNVSDIELHR